MCLCYFQINFQRLWGTEDDFVLQMQSKQSSKLTVTAVIVTSQSYWATSWGDRRQKHLYFQEEPWRGMWGEMLMRRKEKRWNEIWKQDKWLPKAKIRHFTGGEIQFDTCNTEFMQRHIYCCSSTMSQLSAKERKGIPMCTPAFNCPFAPKLTSYWKAGGI